jgi:hypothetical protein
MTEVTTTPNTHALTAEQQAKLESDDAFLRGTAALDILNESVVKTGIVIPPSYVFRKRDKEQVDVAMDAIFELMGGVPRMLLWAHHNDTEFYKAWMKRAGEETAGGGSAVVVVSNMPASGMPHKAMDEHGYVRSVHAEVKSDADDA